MIKINIKETPLQHLIFRSNRYQQASWGNRTNCITLLICSDSYISTHQYKRPAWKQINILWSIFIKSIWYLADKKTYTDFIWFHNPWPACRLTSFSFIETISGGYPDLISSSGEWVLFELLECGVYPGWINQSKRKASRGKEAVGHLSLHCPENDLESDFLQGKR